MPITTPPVGSVYSQLAPHVDAFMLHLLDCRYASNTIDNYLAGLTHFAHWIVLSNIDIKSIDEKS